MSASDYTRRFLFEHASVRGEVIHLEEAAREVLGRRDYPAPVARLLGEAVAASGLLSAILKFQGSLIVQMQGQGSVEMLVASCTNEGRVRGVARHAEAVPDDAPLNALCRDGYLAITIDPDDGGDRYQGIVGLDTERLAGAIDAYFAQSEQLPTRVWLACDGERAAGLLLQRLPGAEDADTDAWNRAEQLGSTITEQELLELPAHDMIRRLFHEEDIRLFDPQPVRFGCHCSRERLIAVLQGLGRAELESLLEEQGQVEAGCEFCGTLYRFDRVDVEQVLKDAGVEPPDATRH